MTASALTIDEMNASLTGRSVRAERTRPAASDELIVARGAGWIDDAASKIASFATLGANWDSHGARPISFGTVHQGLQLVLRFQEFGVPPPVIVPTSLGGVQFEWDCDGVELELELRPDGRMIAIFDDACGDSWDEQLPPNDLARVVPALERIARLGPGR